MLALKQREEGADPRSMTMREAINYHIKEEWQFLATSEENNPHELAHVLTLCSLGPNARPLDYQGSYVSEIFVTPIEDLLIEALAGKLNRDSELRHELTAENFKDKVAKAYNDFYLREVLNRILIVRIREARQARGITESLSEEDIRKEVHHDDGSLMQLAKQEGVEFAFNGPQLGERPFWVKAADGSEFYGKYSKAGKLNALYPEPETGFIDFPYPNEAYIVAFFERIKPALELINTRYPEIERAERTRGYGSHYIYDIPIKEIYDSMGTAREPLPAYIQAPGGTQAPAKHSFAPHNF